MYSNFHHCTARNTGVFSVKQFESMYSNVQQLTAMYINVFSDVQKFTGMYSNLH